MNNSAGQCINWPCALSSGHKGPCDSVHPMQERIWTRENCPDHHYRAMGMCPICGGTLEQARERMKS